MRNRLDNYNYMKILTDWVDKKDIFNKDFVWPRQMEIHLPSNKKIACDFDCYYCFNEDGLKFMANKYFRKLLDKRLMSSTKLRNLASIFGIKTTDSNKQISAIH